jgi:lysophospholipase L1-like esterase
MQQKQILLFIYLITGSFLLNAQTNLPFVPENGDRIVLLGNGLIENEQQFGFLEYGLTSYYAEKHLTFRNLGWSGDTVFGDARSYYTNPPGPYELLISQIKAAQPDWVIIGYGNVEAQEGTSGLPDFKKGLRQLLDSVENIQAKAILLSTIPQAAAGTDELRIKRNADFLLYNAAISEIAENRALVYLDIFEAFKKSDQSVYFEKNGVHLNEAGYYLFAQMIMKKLMLDNKVPEFRIDASEADVQGNVPVEKVSEESKLRELSFLATLKPPMLPISDSLSSYETFQAEGLKGGIYSVHINGKLSAVGSKKDWKNGIAIKASPVVQQSEELLELIREKDKIYFQQYRPQNRTYILGFRSYEQGRHKEGLAALDALILWLDDQINQNKKPVSYRYQLKRLPW